jgi:hypothetical protein
MARNFAGVKRAGNFRGGFREFRLAEQGSGIVKSPASIGPPIFVRVAADSITWSKTVSSSPRGSQQSTALSDDTWFPPCGVRAMAFVDAGW